MLSLFKLFFPAWNFFNEYRYKPVISYRNSPQQDWCDLPELKSEISIGINEKVNLNHSLQNVLFDFIQNQSPVCLKLIENRVLIYLKDQRITQFQYRISLQDLDRSERNVFYESDFLSQNPKQTKQTNPQDSSS
jgi:hypothetical protein